MADTSNGYEAIAKLYLSGRGAGGVVGVQTVREWARTLPRGAAVLDLGCGSGLPVSRVLAEEGANVWGVDASPTMVQAFRGNFPEAQVDCAAAEESAFFNRAFDAVIAWGLLFLLTPEAQRVVIEKAAGALQPGGRFLFTAPYQICSWRDAMTGLSSVSLGREAYGDLLRSAGMSVDAERVDEGENYYYWASKTGSGEGALAR